MRDMWKAVALAAVLMCCAWGVSQIGAQEESKAARSARGGLLAQAADYRFEVFFYPTGVRVFTTDRAGATVNAAGLSGTVTLIHPNSPNPWFARPLSPAAASNGQAAPSLDCVIGLSNVPAKGVAATIEITGLPVSVGTNVSFTVPVEFVGRNGEPSVSQATVGTNPRYSYGPGYYGYGYYQNVGPGATPATNGGMAVNRTYGSHLGHAPTYDWSVGRTNPLAKPWLRPWD